MTLSQKALSRTYAHAFEDLFTTQLSEEVIQRLKKAAQVLEQQRSLPFYLSLTIISDAQKEKALRGFFDAFGCAELIEPLLLLLAKSKRLFLISEIVRQIVEVYMDRRGIVEAQLKTAQPLTVEEQQFFEQYLCLRTSKKVRLTQEIDSALIAGVRVESATWLWEYSVAQQLRMIRASV
jgi:F-type H+-transporting ATPase subunit delta